MLKLILLAALCATVFGAPQAVQWMEIKPANHIVEKPVEDTHPLFQSPYKKEWEDFKKLFSKCYVSNISCDLLENEFFAGKEKFNVLLPDSFNNVGTIKSRDKQEVYRPVFPKKFY